MRDRSSALPEGPTARPLVSVVIPTRDRPELLLDALRSVAAQTYSPLEVIVVDDGSNPEITLDRAPDLALSLIRIDRDVGPASARNRGIAAATGDLVAFLDDDDVWHPEKTERQVAALSAAPREIGMSHTAFEYWPGGGREVRKVARAELRRTVLKGPVIVPSTVMIRRSVLAETGGFDSSLRQMEDWDLFIRVSDVYSSIALSDPLVVRRRHDPVPPTILLENYRKVAARARSRSSLMPPAQRLPILAAHAWWIGLRMVEATVQGTLGDRAWVGGVKLRRRLRAIAGGSQARPRAPRPSPVGGGRLKVCHVITDLDLAGSQLVLRKVLEGMDRQTFDSRVVSLKKVGAVGKAIRDLGIEVTDLGMDSSPGPFNVLPAVLRLRRLLRRERPDVLQTWMYHADLVGTLASIGARDHSLIWNIRHCNLPKGTSRLSTRLVARANARLSTRYPDRIVCNGFAAAEVHIVQGYPRSRIEVIHNGFKPPLIPPNARVEMRVGLGLSEDAVLIGRAARVHPFKDFPTLAGVAVKVCASIPEAHFVLCGEGVTWNDTDLARLIDEHGLRSCFHLLGPLLDMAPFYASLDAAVSPSSEEAFPNVIAETMFAGVPVVATDVGETALIVGEFGRVVPANDPNAFAGALLEVLDATPEEHRRMSEGARRRIADLFPYDQMIDRYEDLYLDVSRG